MESEEDIKKKFERALAKALASPLPKLKYRGPIKKSSLSIGPKATPNPAVLSPKTSVSKTSDNSQDTVTEKLHQPFKQPSLKSRSLKKQLQPSTERSVDNKHLEGATNNSLLPHPNNGRALQNDHTNSGNIFKQGKSSSTAEKSNKQIQQELQLLLRSSNKSETSNHHVEGKAAQSAPRNTEDLEDSSGDPNTGDEISHPPDGKKRSLDVEEEESYHHQVSPSKEHNDDEEDDLPCSGHVSRRHEDDDEISSNIDEEEEFFMHKPRPDRGSNSTMKMRKLNLDALWARIILNKAPAMTNHLSSSKQQQRFMKRNLQRGKCFFDKYISQMKQKLPPVPDNPVFKDDGNSDHPEKVTNKRGRKRKSISQTPKSNKKTRAKSVSNQNKTVGKETGVKAPSRRGSRMKNECQVKSKDQSLRPGGKTRSKSQAIAKTKLVNRKNDTNKSQKLTGKSVSKGVSIRTSSAARASKKSSVREHGGSSQEENRDEQEEDEVVFFDADDVVFKSKSPKTEKTKIIRKQPRKNVTNGVKSNNTSNGNGDRVSKRKVGRLKKSTQDNKSQMKESKWTISPGKGDEVSTKKKVGRPKKSTQGEQESNWMISEPNKSRNVALNVMPLSQLTSTPSVASCESDSAVSGDRQSVAMGDPLVVTSVKKEPTDDYYYSNFSIPNDEDSQLEFDNAGTSIDSPYQVSLKIKKESTDDYDYETGAEDNMDNIDQVSLKIKKESTDDYDYETGAEDNMDNIDTTLASASATKKLVKRREERIRRLKDSIREHKAALEEMRKRREKEEQENDPNLIDL